MSRNIKYGRTSSGGKAVCCKAFMKSTKSKKESPSPTPLLAYGTSKIAVLKKLIQIKKTAP